MTSVGNDMVMPVAPMYGGGYGGNGGFGWGSDMWIILLVLFAFGGFGGGYGMGGFGGFGGFGNMMLGYDFPWLLNGQQGINANTNAGFNQAATQSAISALQNSVTSGFGDVQLGIAGVNQGICQSTGQITSAINNGFSQAEIANNGRQMANMQQMFANQTAMNTGFNGLQAQLAQCCCDNRLATAQTQALVQSENCADRYEAARNTSAIIESQNAGFQRIIDKLCDQELQAERRENANLRQELIYSRGQASQIEQTAQILANNNAQTALFQQGLNNEVDALYNRLSNCPVPSVPVYGRQPIFTCQQNNSCGCGCGNF